MQPARLDDLPPTPATHFRLLFYAAVIEAIQEATVRAASLEDVLGRHRFLATYLNELADRGLDGGTLDAAPMWWRGAVEAWEASIPDRLPLRALAAAAGLDYESLVLLAGAGLAVAQGNHSGHQGGRSPWCDLYCGNAGKRPSLF